MRRAVLWTLGIATAVGCLTAANLRHELGPVEVDWRLFRPAPPAVAVGAPTRGAIARTVASKGVVEPIRQAQVVAKVSGKVAEVCVEEGAPVRPGISWSSSTTPRPGRGRRGEDPARDRPDQPRDRRGPPPGHRKRPRRRDDSAAPSPSARRPAGRLPRGAACPNRSRPARRKLEAARNSLDGWKRERKAADSADEAARVDLDRTSIRATIDGVVEDLAVEVGDDVFAGPSIRPSTDRPTAPTRA